VDVIGHCHYPAYLAPERKPPLFIIGGSFGPKAGLDALEKRKIPYPYLKSKYESSVAFEL